MVSSVMIPTIEGEVKLIKLCRLVSIQKLLPTPKNVHCQPFVPATILYSRGHKWLTSVFFVFF